MKLVIPWNEAEEGRVEFPGSDRYTRWIRENGLRFSIRNHIRMNRGPKYFAEKAVFQTRYAPEKAPERPAPEETAALLKNLSSVTKWEAPVKRGRFTVDDKKFFESLNKQFKEKKALSEKQTAALKKLAAKYGEK